MIEHFLDFVLPISSLEPYPIFQFVVFAPSIDYNIPLPDSGGFSPTLDCASNNIAQELYDSDLHVLVASPAQVLLRRFTR